MDAATFPTAFLGAFSLMEQANRSDMPCEHCLSLKLCFVQGIKCDAKKHA
jgi:hypothetical protein